MTTEQKIASIASMPQREKSLKLAISSVITQVDEVYVYLNNYAYIPIFLSNKKIKIYRSQDFGDLGDRGKFFGLQFSSGYFFSLDDDLLYPENYIAKLIEKIEQYQRKAFICVHANLLPKKPLQSYYQDKVGIHFAKALHNDQHVEVPGTGTLGFHASLYQLNWDDFPTLNMSDIWLYKIAKIKNIPIIAIKRPDAWIKPLSLQPDPQSIYARYSKNDAEITKIVNSIQKNQSDLCKTSNS